MPRIAKTEVKNLQKNRKKTKTILKPTWERPAQNHIRTLLLYKQLKLAVQTLGGRISEVTAGCEEKVTFVAWEAECRGTS